jgi:quercetin dioxygenase-like cupin family protein
MSEASHPVVAAALARSGLPDWMPDGDGKWSLPLQFLPDEAGWVELMHLAPGVRIGLHRHSGEVHALNLQGTRHLNDGRVIGPGGYVHEPAGNVDWWESAPEGEPLVVAVVVKGSVEYLGAHRSVTRRITTADRIADYERHCRSLGLQPRDLLSS